MTTEDLESADVGDALPTAPLPFDATDLFLALQYQLVVAIDYCHKLEPGQRLWIELLGDVTIEGSRQVEVKHFSDDLTDSHPNFWNTIKNWLHEDFPLNSYSRLTLLSTQGYGAMTLLKEWNSSSAAERLAIMEKIVGRRKAAKASASAKAAASPRNADIEVETSERAGEAAATFNDQIIKKVEDASDPAKDSKSQTLQAYVMAAERRDALMLVLERMQIITCAPTLQERIQQYITQHLKAIRPMRCQQYVADLLGFMWSPERLARGWCIEYKEFTDKITDLTKAYIRHPTYFPRIDTDAIKQRINLQEVKAMRFAQKIEEIGFSEHLMRAAVHRAVAEKTIADFIEDSTASKSDLDLYFDNTRGQHRNVRESAMHKCRRIQDSDALKEMSQDFYLERLASTIDPFCGMDSTTPDFRNGVFHLLADDQPKDADDEFHWRLWK